ncbi:MAG: ParA family protein [Acidimicrobiaceae bacterium]|nr:ParA family protein [Acidimicrobiaceae bacterium]
MTAATPPQTEPSARVAISVINMKGGVGKTTIATLPCRRFARAHKVLAIDLVPQANMSQALMGEAGYRQFMDDESPSVVEVLKGYQPPGSVPSPTPLDPAEIARVVVRGRGELRIVPSRFDFSDNLCDATRTDVHALARFIANGFRDVDIVLIDCAPTESVLTRAAYHASRYVLVPVRPEFFATIGFPLLHASLEAFREGNPGHELDVLGVVINDAGYGGGNDGGPEKARAMVEIKNEAAQHDWRIFSNQIPYSRGFPKMMRGDYNWLGKARESFYPFERELRRCLSEEGYLP